LTHTITPVKKGTLWKVIGEECESCGVAATHFICPHCNEMILLDGTRPATPPASAPLEKISSGEQKNTSKPKSLSDLFKDDLK
jgi:hypothetical protein